MIADYMYCTSTRKQEDWDNGESEEIERVEWYVQLPMMPGMDSFYQHHGRPTIPAT